MLDHLRHLRIKIKGLESANYSMKYKYRCNWQQLNFCRVIPRRKDNPGNSNRHWERVIISNAYVGVSLKSVKMSFNVMITVTDLNFRFLWRILMNVLYISPLCPFALPAIFVHESIPCRTWFPFLSWIGNNFRLWPFSSMVHGRHKQSFLASVFFILFAVCPLNMSLLSNLLPKIIIIKQLRGFSFLSFQYSLALV